MEVVLVDDNADFRSGLKMFIEEHLGYKVLKEFDNGQSFVDNSLLKADIILMDINMPQLNGMEAAKMGTWNKRDMKLIAVSQFKESVDINVLIGAGFRGFVSKTNVFKELSKAIETVLKGEYYFPDELEVLR